MPQIKQKVNIFNKIKWDFDHLVQEGMEKVADFTRSYFFKEFMKGAFTLKNSLGNWDPLDPKTVKEKSQKGYPYPDAALIRTGALSRAIAHMAWTRTSRGIKLTIDSKYASYHNEGTGRLPERKFIDTNNPEFKAALQDYWNQQLKKYFK